MSKLPPVAIWEGTIAILGVTLRVYVLDDGRRIVSAEDLERLVKEGAVDDATPLELSILEAFSNGKGIPDE